MSSLVVVRGNYIVITTTFYNANGDKTAPAATPVAHFAWPGGASGAVNMVATADPAVFTLEWDTSPVTNTRLDWSVRAQAAAGLYFADNGTIKLDINLANSQT